MTAAPAVTTVTGSSTAEGDRSRILRHAHSRFAGLGYIATLAVVLLLTKSDATLAEAIATILCWGSLVLSFVGFSESPAARVPILYLSIVGLLGMIAALSGNASRVTDTSVPNWGLAYGSAAIVALAILRYGSRRPTGVPTLGYQEPSIYLIAVITLLAGIGIVSVFRTVPPNFLADPQAARAVISGSLSPQMQTLYKLSVIVALCLASRTIASYSGWGRAWRIVALLSVAFVVLSAYGGRFLAMSTAVGITVLWIHKSVNVKWFRLAVSAAVLYSVAVVVAAFRYYSFHGAGLTKEGLWVTAISQPSGEFVDGLRLHSLGLHGSGARSVLLSDLTGSFPAVMRKYFGLHDVSSTSFGTYASRALGMEEIGGIRVGVMGEWVLSFGALGAVIVGVTLGVVCWLVGRIERVGGMSSVFAVAVSLMTVGVLVLGTEVAVSSFSVLLLAWLAWKVTPGSTKATEELAPIRGAKIGD